jgi:hypothetical protein
MSCPTVQIKSSDPAQGAFVVINESDFDAAKGHERYVAPPPAAVLPPPPLPPPPAPDALAGLPKNWRELKPRELVAFAERIEGRTPTNREEAVAMIEGELVKRK